MNNFTFKIYALPLFLLTALIPARINAGPPYVTDDPEPVEYRHYEFYIASQSQIAKDSKEITLPHFEINYGLVPDIQVHMIAPLSYVRASGETGHYGYSDMELGVKYRFVHESDYIPMVGIFPMIELPTGDKNRGLGSGKTGFFLPLWFQKSAGHWSGYGGCGYRINPGEGNKNYWMTGWLVQREFEKLLSIGAEIFYRGASETGGTTETGFNIGTVINFGETHHLLASAGRDIKGPNRFTSYIAYQLTAGIGE